MGSSTHLDKKAPERRFNKPHKTCVEEKEMGIIPDGDARHPGLHVKSIATKWARNGSGWGAGLALLFPSFFLGFSKKGLLFPIDSLLRAVLLPKASKPLDQA